MSSGYGAGIADVITNKDLDKITGGLVTTLENHLKENEYDLNSYAYDIYIDDVGKIKKEATEKANEIYEEIKKVFEKKTKLTVELLYHDSENNGDRYDEVDGAFWDVFGMYDYTTAGKKMKDTIVRKYFVNYG